MIIPARFGIPGISIFGQNLRVISHIRTRTGFLILDRGSGRRQPTARRRARDDPVPPRQGEGDYLVQPEAEEGHRVCSACVFPNGEMSHEVIHCLRLICFFVPVRL